MRLVVEVPWLKTKISQLSELLDECVSSDEINLVDKLIREFMHVELADMQLTLSHVAQFIENLGKPEEIIICATAFGSQPDGSQMIINMLKNQFSHTFLEKVSFCNRLNNLKKKIDNQHIIVLVDDFVGTGQTLRGRLAYSQTELREYFKGLGQDPKLRFYACAPAGMESGVALLESLFDGFFCENRLQKGISDNFPKESVQKNLDIMINIESRLSPRVMDKDLPSLGYGQAEALYAFGDTNIPNSVFPWFWWPSFANNDERPRLFKRAEL